MPLKVPVDGGGDLIVETGEAHRCHSTTACRNMVDCLQGCTAQVASGADIFVVELVSINSWLPVSLLYLLY